jgi:NAD(P)-dependent dehydrogenase (short-subunit alcohol dehydrogenase family)
LRPLSEQAILVTGSTDGLGRVVAERLAAAGAMVLVHGRDPAKVDRVAGEIGAARGLVADLAVRDDVVRLADEAGDLDGLVNNAGVYTPERRETADGRELAFAVNHLSHFRLTLQLLPRLREPARIVNVSSLGQEPVDLDDLDFERGWAPFSSYARSKLAQVLFTFELAKRVGGREIAVNALHPATFMDTNMVRASGATAISSVQEGADAVLRLLSDPALDGVTGRFFDGTREVRADAQAYDADARRRLWEESERLTS